MLSIDPFLSSVYALARMATGDGPGFAAKQVFSTHARRAMRRDLASVHQALASSGRAVGRSKNAPQDEDLRDAVREIEPRHLAEVRRILRRHACGLEVRAFGSRARGGAKPHSNLGLAVMTKNPLPMKVEVELESALAESDLPFRVDLLHWDETSDAFRRLVEEGWELVQEGLRQEG